MAKSNYEFMSEYDMIEDITFDLQDDTDITIDNDEESIPEDYNCEKETKQEIGEVLKKIKENEKKYMDEKNEETENNFYFSIIFRNNKEMDNFLKEKNIILHRGDHVFIEEIKEKFI
jgi:hypothetical protein